MIQLLLLFFAAWFGSPTQTYFEFLKKEVIVAYGDSSRYEYRVKQVRAESNFNPRATSDFKGWRKQKLDTVTAIRNNMGAAGLSQFIFATAERYGANAVNTNAADENNYSTDIYNPFWSLRSMCKYMKAIDVFLIARTEPKVRARLISNRKFAEQCATASYNAGEGRVVKLLKKYATWDVMKYHLPAETRTYSNKIVKD